jgi:hypothetical protein
MRSPKVLTKALKLIRGHSKHSRKNINRPPRAYHLKVPQTPWPWRTCTKISAQNDELAADLYQPSEITFYT